MTKFEQIKQKFPGACGTIDLYTDDGTQYYFIDIDADRIEGPRAYTLACGCCTEYEQYDYDLSYELEYMSDGDFQLLIEELEKL